MREALRSLTTRGRGFLAAGLTAVVCAAIVGEVMVIRVGVVACILPLVAAWFMARRQYQLTLVRDVTPATVSVGQPGEVSLTLTNAGRSPGGYLMLEDHLPFALGTRPRFLLEGIGRGWERHVTYQVRSEIRGVFEIGPMSVRASDPFGLVEVARSFRATTPLVVTPRTVPLAPIPLNGTWSGSGDNRPRSFAVGSAEDVSVREYRRGDDLRRVHWHSSARVGELMVRREEQPWQSRATVFLDNRAGSHLGSGAGSSLEAAVTAAASVAVHLSQRGFTVRLITATGEHLASRWHQRGDRSDTASLLESLAVVQLVQAARMDLDWLGESTADAMTVAVLGRLDPHDHGFLRRLAVASAPALALVHDVSAWGSDPDPRLAESSLRAATAMGWRAAAVDPLTPLATAWQSLAQSGGRVGAHRAEAR